MNFNSASFKEMRISFIGSGGNVTVKMVIYAGGCVRNFYGQTVCMGIKCADAQFTTLIVYFSTICAWVINAVMNAVFSLTSVNFP